LVGVAVNVTLVPWQTVPDGTAAIAIDTAALAVTEAVMVFEVAGLLLVQASEEVKMQITWSLFDGAKL